MLKLKVLFLGFERNKIQIVSDGIRRNRVQKSCRVWPAHTWCDFFHTIGPDSSWMPKVGFKQLDCCSHTTQLKSRLIKSWAKMVSSESALTDVCDAVVAGNMFGEQIRSILENNPDMRTSYVLMERITPPSFQNYIVPPGEDTRLWNMDNELGIYGVVLGWGYIMVIWVWGKIFGLKWAFCNLGRNLYRRIATHWTRESIRLNSQEVSWKL